MAFPRQMKDLMYRLLQEPTLDKFRDFLKDNTGEHNSIDFKGKWIEGAQLAKEMLALANTDGGIIVFGIAEGDDNSVKYDGLEKLRDHAEISNDIKKFISSDLKYEVYDFSYNSSEYSDLEGKNFQLLVVEDTPENIPFLAKKESTNLKPNAIYVRRGTSCEIANEEEIRSMINRRINYIHPLNGEPLQLEEHLKQLKILYNSIQKEKVSYISLTEGFGAAWRKILLSITKGGEEIEPNPLYPEEEYEEFIARMITEKKKKIERVLDLY